MDAINNIENIFEMIAELRQRSKDCITNFYPNDEKLNYWIKKEIFFSEYLANTIFFIRKDRDFFHLYFCSKNLLTLQEDLKSINAQFPKIFVADCIGTGTNLETLVDVFEQCKFKKYILYNRMKKLVPINELLPDVSQDVIFPDLEDAPIIAAMFESNFDRFAEQLPTIEELEIAITNREVTIIKDSINIVGVLIRKMAIKSSLWMFFLVNKEYRNKKVGSRLLSYYFNECRNKRIIMWVLANNVNAIEIYKHYGFTFDSLNDQIMTNKNIQYETKNN